MTKLESIYEEAETFAKNITAFSKKQKIDFVDSIPAKDGSIVVQFASGYDMIMFEYKDILFDLENNIEQLRAIEYSNYMEKLAMNNSFDDYCSKIVEYKEWLGIT